MQKFFDKKVAPHQILIFYLKNPWWDETQAWYCSVFKKMEHSNVQTVVS